VVDELGWAFAVDDDGAVAESKEIGDGGVLVEGVGSSLVMRGPVYSATRAPLRMGVVVKQPVECMAERPMMSPMRVCDAFLW